MKYIEFKYYLKPIQTPYFKLTQTVVYFDTPKPFQTYE